MAVVAVAPPAAGDFGSLQEAVRKHIESLIAENRLVMFGKAWCPYCAKGRD